MTIDEMKGVVLRFNKEFLEAGNPEVLTELVAPGFINHTAPPGFPNDVNGLIQVTSLIHKGFSNVRIEIHEQVAEGEMVASRKTIHGTHTGEIMGKKPTGKEIAIQVMDFVRLKNGRYTHHWRQNNLMQVIQSL